MIQERNFKSIYSLDDIPKLKNNFKKAIAEYFGFTSRKNISRTMKKYKWYDFYYFNKFFKLKLKPYQYVELLNLDDSFIISEEERIEISNKITKMIEPSFEDEKFNNLLSAFLDLSAANYYYHAWQVDEDVEEIYDSLLILSQMLKTKDISPKLIAKYYADNYYKWWD